MDPNELAVVLQDDSSGSDEDENRIQNGIIHEEDVEEAGLGDEMDSSSSSDTSSSSSLFHQNNPKPTPRTTRTPSRDSNSSQHRHHHRNLNRHISYDKSLPIQHSYLGSNLTELTGRIVLDDDSVTTISLLSLPGVILVPGQVLPMQIQHPSLIAMIKKIIESNRTFGLTCSSSANESRLGTTAEIRSFSLEDDNLRMKAEGRQVFLIQETWRGIDGILMGRVKVLPEVDLVHPYNRNCLNSAIGVRMNKKHLPVSTPLPSFVYDMYDPQVIMQRIMIHLEHWTMFERTGNITRESTSSRTSSGAGPSSLDPHNSSSPEQRKRYEVTTSVLRTSASIDNGINEEEEFDEEEEEEALEFEREVAPSASELRESFQRQTSHGDSPVPTSPAEFSFWVAGNLPLDDHYLLEFLSLTCCVQRLRWLLSILSRYLYISCSRCKTKICRKDDVFSMSLHGPQGTYVNPSGYVHETITVYRAESLSLRDDPSTEFSWFPGYAWTVCDCSQCGVHIGWKFTTTKDKSLQPEFFWGLIRSSITLGFRSSSQASHFRPVI